MLAPSLDTIAKLGEAVLESLPEPFRGLAGDIPVIVKDWPDSETLANLGIDDALSLTGLYHAIPIGDRLGEALPPVEPERIELYRLPILFEWCNRNEPLENVVFDVLTHEIGHHFGMDEAQVMRMEGVEFDR